MKSFWLLALLLAACHDNHLWIDGSSTSASGHATLTAAGGGTHAVTVHVTQSDAPRSIDLAAVLGADWNDDSFTTTFITDTPTMALCKACPVLREDDATFLATDGWVSIDHADLSIPGRLAASLGNVTFTRWDVFADAPAAAPRTHFVQTGDFYVDYVTP